MDLGGASAATIAPVAIAAPRRKPVLKLDDAEAARLGRLRWRPGLLDFVLFFAWFHDGTSLRSNGGLRNKEHIARRADRARGEAGPVRFLLGVADAPAASFVSVM